MIRLADYVARFVADLGVKQVFMLPGGFAMHLNDAFGACPDLEIVCNLHEQACGVAAEAYARVTGNLGVALVTAGPGSTNAVTGVAAAWLDSTPCLFISGQAKRADLKGDSGVRQLGVQEIDIVSIVKPITKYAVTVLDPTTIRYHLERSLHLAKSGRPGPVWIDLPLDVQGSPLEAASLAGYQPEPVTHDETQLDQQLDQVLSCLERAERPVILAGNGIRIAGAPPVFEQLVQALQIPVLTTRLGVDLLPAESPFLVGMPGTIATRAANFALQNSDCLLILGARVDLALIAYAPERLARAAIKIMVNIDGAEMTKLKGIIDLPIAVDVGRFLRRLVARLGSRRAKDYSPWIQRCREWRERYPFVLPHHLARKDGISAYAFSALLTEELPGDIVVLPGSSGFAAEIFLTAFQAKRNQRVFHNKGTGAMGLGQPAAIGACLAAGRRRTVCVDGDGGFQLNIQELETVRRLGLPITFFVINNQGFASIRASQQQYFQRLAAADATSGLTLPDLAGVAQAYGLAFVRVARPEGLREQLREVLAMPGPVLCEVCTIPDEPREPRVAATRRPDGSMVSKPLEDMYPPLDREEFLSNMIIPPLEE